MGDSSEATSRLICVQLLITNPVYNPTFVQGMLSAFGIKMFLECVITACSSDNRIVDSYSPENVMKNIPKTYYTSHTNVYDELLNSSIPVLTPDVESSNNIVTSTNSFSKLSDMFEAMSKPEEGAQDIRVIDGKQHISIDMKNTRDLYYLAQRINAQVNGETAQEQVKNQSDVSVGAVLTLFSKVVSGVTIDHFISATFTCSQLLYSNLYIDNTNGNGLKNKFSIDTINKFITQVVLNNFKQLDNKTSQYPKIVSNKTVADLNKGTGSFGLKWVIIKVLSLFGFTSSEIITFARGLIASNENNLSDSELSNDANDLASLYSDIVNNDNLSERLALFSTDTPVEPNKSLLKSSDKANEILDILYNNIDSEFTKIEPLTAVDSKKDPVSIETLSKLAIAKYIVNQLTNSPVNRPKGVVAPYGVSSFTLDSFINENKDFAKVFADAVKITDVGEVKYRVNGIDIKSLSDSSKVEILKIKFVNDPASLLNVFTNIVGQQNTTIDEYEAYLTELVVLTGFTLADILLVPAGAWSLNKSPILLYLRKALRDESNTKIQNLINFSKDNLVLVRDVLLNPNDDEDKATQDDLDKFIHFCAKLQIADNVLPLLGSTATEQIKHVKHAMDNDDAHDGSLYFIYLTQIGLVACADAFGKILAAPVVFTVASGKWHFAFHDLESLQYLKGKDLLIVENALTYKKELEVVNTQSGVITDKVTTLLYKPTDIKVVFELTDVEFVNTLEALGYQPNNTLQIGNPIVIA